MFAYLFTLAGNIFKIVYFCRSYVYLNKGAEELAMGRHYFWYDKKGLSEKRLMDEYSAICDLKLKMAEWMGRKSSVDAEIQVLLVRQEGALPGFCAIRLEELEAESLFIKYKIEELVAHTRACEVRLSLFRKKVKEKGKSDGESDDKTG